MFVLPTLVIERRDLEPFIQAFKAQGNYKGDIKIVKGDVVQTKTDGIQVHLVCTVPVEEPKS